jgi:hypothetical protein
MRSYGIPGETFSGWEPHHPIPSEAAAHPIIIKIGMNLDAPSNGIMLRASATNWPGNLPTHKGYHSLFSKQALAELNKMDVNLPVEVMQLKVFGLQQRLRMAIEEALPLYYAKGGTDQMWQQALGRPVPR